MKKNGFTLVELLTVLILFGLLLAIGIPGVMLIRQKISERALVTKIKLIESAATLYGQDNKTILTTDRSEDCPIDDSNNKVQACKRISIDSLIEEGFMDSDANNGEYKNPVNDKDLANISNCYAIVYIKNNRVYSYFGEKSCRDGF